MRFVAVGFIEEKQMIRKATVKDAVRIAEIDAFELAFLYVDPFFSRQGIGSQLIKYFEDEGINLGYKEFIIWVLEKNEIGKNCFFEKWLSF